MNSKNNTKTTILGNERSEGGVLISEMNKLFDKRDWNFKSAVGELTVSTKNATDNRNEALFPDAIVFEDKENLTPAIGWEFKMPDTPINDDELFSNAKDKANRLGTNVIVLWNFQYCHVFYRKDDKGWSRNPNRIYDQYSNILTDRKNVYNNKAIYVKQLEQVLQDLNADYINNLYQVAPIKFNIDNYINTIADTLTPLLANHLLDLHDPILLAKMKNFSLNEKAEFGSDKPLKGVSKEKTAAITYSKNIVIRWMNRIIFSNLIRTKYNIISSLLNTFISENNIDKFKDDFNNAIRSTDFYSILHVKDEETELPQPVVSNLAEFCSYLWHVDITKFDSSMVSKILESLISVSKHKLMGLYTTPINLAQLLVQITLIDTKGDFADFTVGSGTIAKATIDYMRKLGISMSDIHNHVWISDKYDFPLQVANFNITTFDSLNLMNIVFKHDALDLKVGEKIAIVNPQNGDLEEKSLPKMKAIMSNLPFISSNNRQSKEDKQLIKKILTEHDMDLRSDLYQALILKYKTLLSDSPKARIGVITSNSWFKNKPGRTFFDILIENFDIKYIVYSDVARWFDNADVVSSIIVLGNKSKSANKIQFISLRKDIRDMKADDITEITDAIITDNNHPSIAKYSYDIGEIKSLMKDDLSLEAFFDNISWFNDLKNTNKLKPLSTYCHIFRGSRTGRDEIFITDGLKTDKEDSHLYLKTIKEINSIEAKPTNRYFFYTTDSIETLKQKRHSNTLAYIDSISNTEAAQKQIKKHGEKWYTAEDTPKYGDFVTTLNPDKRFFWAGFKKPVAVNQRVVAAQLKKGYSKEKTLILALLNSVISLYILCGSGFARADGVTDLTADEIGQLMILDPSYLSLNDKEHILNKWKKLQNKPIYSIFEELQDDDWIEFNKEVLKAYDLDSEVFDHARDAIFKLVNRRDNIKKSKR